MKGKFKKEIEVKLRVADATTMRSLLRRLGGRVKTHVHEMNTLFDTPRGTLRKRGRLMRLREETNQLGQRSTSHGKQKAQRKARFVLTFKGPSEKQVGGGNGGGRYKVRKESEFVFDDARAFLALARQEGVRPSFRYEKYRTSYRIPRAGVHVELDETTAGTFLELEGPRRAIDRMARRLGYQTKDYLTKSYVALHLDECRRRGVRAGDMVFRTRKK